MSALAFTGERFLPECKGEIWLEHWHRYHFAAACAQGRRVLDVASGEGYGSALLAAAATTVVGADVSPEAVAHARDSYALPNLRFVAADCARLPFADGSFELVVSFETIEHIERQRDFIAEVRRVLAPGGLLLLSSPNKAEYTDRRGYANPFHVSELYRAELHSLLAEFFPHARWYGQRIGFCSTITGEAAAAERGSGELVEPDTGAVREPLYFLVGCALDEGALQVMHPEFSVLDDPDDTVYRDYQETYRKFVAASEAITALRDREIFSGHALEGARRSAGEERIAAAARAESLQASIDRLRSELVAAQARLLAGQSEVSLAHAQRDEALAALARKDSETNSLREGFTEQKARADNLGASLHSAHQAALRLTDALHAANARYQAALEAAHAAARKLADENESARLSYQSALAQRDAQIDELQERVAAQSAELDRRLGWRWRLRRPALRG